MTTTPGPARRAGHPVAPVLPGVKDNNTKSTPEGWPSAIFPGLFLMTAGHRAQGTERRAQGTEHRAKRRRGDEETAGPQDRGKPHEFLSINDILLIVIRQIFYLKRYYFLSSCDCAVCASRAGSFIFYKLPRRFSA